MLKNVKFARESKYSTKGSLAKECLNFLSSQLNSDDIPLEVKLDDVKNTEMRKANKSVKMRTQILFKLFHNMLFKWKK